MNIGLFKIVRVRKNDEVKEFSEGEKIYIELNNGKHYESFIEELHDNYMIILVRDGYVSRKKAINYDEIITFR